MTLGQWVHHRHPQSITTTRCANRHDLNLCRSPVNQRARRPVALRTAADDAKLLPFCGETGTLRERERASVYICTHAVVWAIFSAFNSVTANLKNVKKSEKARKNSANWWKNHGKIGETYWSWNMSLVDLHYFHLVLVLPGTWLITEADGSSGGRGSTGVCLSLCCTTRYVCLSVCLFIRMISQKLMQLGSPNLTYKSDTMSPGNSFILGSKVKVTSHKSSAGVGLCTLVSAGFF